jgi:hypothetical protein
MRDYSVLWEDATIHWLANEFWLPTQPPPRRSVFTREGRRQLREWDKFLTSVVRAWF